MHCLVLRQLVRYVKNSQAFFKTKTTLDFLHEEHSNSTFLKFQITICHFILWNLWRNATYNLVFNLLFFVMHSSRFDVDKYCKISQGKQQRHYQFKAKEASKSVKFRNNFETIKKPQANTLRSWRKQGAQFLTFFHYHRARKSASLNGLALHPL